MSRLVLICAPICTIGCAIWCGFVLDFALEPILLLLGKKGYKGSEEDDAGEKCSGKNGDKSPVKNGAAESKAKAKSDAKDAKGKENKGKQAADSGKGKSQEKASAKKATKHAGEFSQTPLEEHHEDHRPGGIMQIKHVIKSGMWESVPESTRKSYVDGRAFIDRNPLVLLARLGLSAAVLYTVIGYEPKVTTFVQHCHSVAKSLSNPKVVTMMRDRVHGMVKMDDYLKGYQWIDQNTPKDARVIAWWDYGYQITGIAKRTSIADGNTWNHEHIATLGRTLTSPEKKAHNAIRHIADYLLVWAGGGGDDLAKSPHLARIGNSVFPEHCGDDDPRCNKFGFHQDRSPTPMMAKSLLYKAVMHNLVAGVKLDPRFFKEVHTTKHGKMRVYQVMNISQESKDWIADPQNKICDAPGSWYCVGQYPPALAKLISKRKNFNQVEDFNRVGEKSAYTKMIEKERSGGGREL